MFYSITGKVSHKEEGFFVIICGGIGYKCSASIETISKLPADSEQTTVYTHMYVREDALELFAFASPAELDCFKLLISVSGVGPKAAIAVLSELSPERFAIAVVSGDHSAIKKAQGIGIKTSQRIILELKDKLSKKMGDSSQNINPVSVGIDGKSPSAQSDAINALAVLGYSVSEVTPIIAKLDPNMTTEDLIKYALRQLSQQ